MTGTRTATLFALLLLAPALVYILAIVAYPLADTINLSFTNAALRPTYSWVGWANYQKIFQGHFDQVIIRTIIWTFFSVSIKMVIGTFGAVLLNAAVPGRALFRVLTMPPWIVPMAIGIFMWGWMYNGQFGMISGLLQNFHLVNGPVAFLAYGNTAFWATIFTDVWIGAPLERRRVADAEFVRPGDQCHMGRASTHGRRDDAAGGRFPPAGRRPLSGDLVDGAVWQRPRFSGWIFE